MITAGVFALVGTATGAGIAQVGPVVSSVSRGRQQRAKAAAERARAQADNRRSLYLKLINDAHYAAGLAASLHRLLLTDRGDLGTLLQSARECLSDVYTAATTIKVDGSERGKRIATELINGVTDLARELGSGPESITGPSVTKALVALTDAEAELVEAARTEFGR